MINNFVSKKEIKNTLKECLEDLPVSELKNLCSLYDVKGTYKMKKADIVIALGERMRNHEAFFDLYAALLEENSESERLYSDYNGEEYEEAVNRRGHYLMNKIGMSYFYKNSEGAVGIVPTECIDLIESLDDCNLEKKSERYSLIKKYIIGFLNIYGMYEVEYLIDIFNKQNQEKIDAKELMSVVKIYNIFNETVEIYKNYLAHEVLFMGPGEIEKLEADRQNKEYYIPSKELVLNYGDEFYIEETKAHKELHNYIKTICKDSEIAEGLFEDICIGLNDNDLDAQYIVFEFERRGIKFSKIEQVNKLIGLSIKVNNNTRKWSNKGWMPSELHIDEAVLPITNNKVGRNDPCICGSGKKYKKCCG